MNQNTLLLSYQVMGETELKPHQEKSEDEVQDDEVGTNK